MRAYALLDPSFPQQILDLAKSEANHRQKNESALVDHEIAQKVRDSQQSKRGQLFAVLTVFFGLLTALTFGYWGMEAPAKWIGVAVVSIVGLFITNEYYSRKKTK